MSKALLSITETMAGINEKNLQGDLTKASCVSVDSVQQRGSNVLTEIIAGLKDGTQVHFFTNGAWNMHQLLTALFEITGSGTVYLATYAISETAARTLTTLKDNGFIKQLHCLIDNRTDTRSAGSLQLLKAISNTCTLAACHAKITIIEGRHASVVVVGSANYTENKRYESGFITTDKTACNFHKQWMKSEMNG